MNGAENIEHVSVSSPFQGKAVLRYMHIILLVIGILSVLASFFLLKNFVTNITQQQQTESSQKLVQSAASEFKNIVRTGDGLAQTLSVINMPDIEDIQSMIASHESEYRYYKQIVWFYKMPNNEWSFTELLGKDDNALKNHLKPSVELLKSALAQEIIKSVDMTFLDYSQGFERNQDNGDLPLSSRYMLAGQAVEANNEYRGFLLYVINFVGTYDAAWIESNPYAAYIRMREVGSANYIYEFSRDKDKVAHFSTMKQTYELPFGDQNLEVSGLSMPDKRFAFLDSLLYLVLAFGGFFLISGLFFIKASQQQSEKVLRFNEELALKNKALKSEVDARNRLKTAVEIAEQRSSAVINAIGDIILETNPKGDIVFLNNSWQKITGFDIQQTLGQSLAQIIHADDRDQIMQGFENLLKGKSEEVRAFTRLRLVDGGFKPVELVLRIVLIKGQQEQRVIGTFTDIEERRRAELALSLAEKKYRSIVENAAGGIFQMTQEGVYLSANPAFANILGFKNANELMRDVKNANEQLFENVQQRNALYKRLFEGGESVRHKVQMRKQDGSQIWVYENIRGVLDSNGQLMFLEGSIEDITERLAFEAAIKKAQNNSELANRAKSEFLSNMSHELRTPLNAIIGFSEMIKNEVYGAIKERAYWEYACDINDSGTKLLNIINEILDISKIEAGDRQLNEGVIRLPDVVEAALILQEGKIEASKLVITKSLENIPHILGEELAIKQIILNLLSNAVKFTPNHGRITISGHVARDGDLHFSITDTGVGLDEAEIKKALSPFGQADNDLSRSGSGTGLGLTLVDALVKLHGGAFELFSQKGIGTTATVIFPKDRIVQNRDKVSASQNSFSQESNMFKAIITPDDAV